MNGDGTGAQQLTPMDSLDYEPQVSPDGRFIVFTSERTGEWKIWRMNIDGSNSQLLTPVNGAAFGAVITPDGKDVLFQWIKDNKRVWGKVPLAGGEISEQPLISNSFMSISPDGKQVAYATRDETDNLRKVCIHPIDRGEPKTCLNISPIEFMIWAKDGQGLLYRSVESSPESNSTVWLQSLTGGEPKPFLSVKPDSVFKISQSADGKQTAVVRGKLLTDAVMLSKIEPH
jgi:Tol biopolymer transport system component